MLKCISHVSDKNFKVWPHALLLRLWRKRHSHTIADGNVKWYNSYRGESGNNKITYIYHVILSVNQSLKYTDKNMKTHILYVCKSSYDSSLCSTKDYCK